MNLSLSTAVGLAAVVLAVAVSVPQFARLLRTGHVSGVSLAAVTNSSISFGAWTIYAVAIGDLWLTISSAVGLPGQAATAWLAWRRGASRQQMWVPALWLAVLLAVAGLDVAAGMSMTTIVVGGSILWLVVPALVTAWRSHDVSGIAPATWWVLGLEGAIFLVYGITVGVAATVLYGVACLVGSGGVLARVAGTGSRVRPGPGNRDGSRGTA
jgi:uncharacterized protein with PQ loop repeat